MAKGKIYVNPSGGAGVYKIYIRKSSSGTGQCANYNASPQNGIPTVFTDVTAVSGLTYNPATYVLDNVPLGCYDIKVCNPDDTCCKQFTQALTNEGCETPIITSAVLTTPSNDTNHKLKVTIAGNTSATCANCCYDCVLVQWGNGIYGPIAGQYPDDFANLGSQNGPIHGWGIIPSGQTSIEFSVNAGNFVTLIGDSNVLVRATALCAGCENLNSGTSANIVKSPNPKYNTVFYSVCPSMSIVSGSIMAQYVGSFLNITWPPVSTATGFVVKLESDNPIWTTPLYSVVCGSNNMNQGWGIPLIGTNPLNIGDTITISVSSICAETCPAGLDVPSSTIPPVTLTQPMVGYLTIV